VDRHAQYDIPLLEILHFVRAGSDLGAVFAAGVVIHNALDVVGYIRSTAKLPRGVLGTVLGTANVFAPRTSLW
jgi:hypothetical protein